MIQGAQQAMNLDIPMPGDGGSGVGDYFSSGFAPAVYTTNDLWLEMVAVTNRTASLVIHPPWNVTNGVWGMYFTTNIAAPMTNWTRLLQNAPGQTNLVVMNLPSDLGFFRLGPPSAIRPGFTNNTLAPNDDDYCCLVSGDGGGGYDKLTNLLAALPFPINFFGKTHTSLYVNNNGNVTFDFDLSSYTPEPLAGLYTAIIAPFWADVDTRSTNSGLVTYGTNTVNGHAAFGVNWIGVGYFYYGCDRTNSFQLVLIDRSDRASGDYDVEFNYALIQWEAGVASGGEDGLWTGCDNWTGEHDGYGESARSGFASDLGRSFELNGSAVPRAFLDTNLVTGLVHTNYNSTNGILGRYVYPFHNGTNNLAHR